MDDFLTIPIITAILVAGSLAYQRYQNSKAYYSLDISGKYFK